MLGKIAAHAGEIHDGIDPQLAQLVRGTDAGQHQQLRRVIRTCAHDDLSVCEDPLQVAITYVLHTDGLAVFDQNPVGERVCFDPKILAPPEDRVQIGPRGTGATTLAVYGHFPPREPFLDLAVEILRDLEPCRSGGLHQRLMQKARRIDRHHAQRTTVSVIVVSAAPTRLHSLEVR